MSFSQPSLSEPFLRLLLIDEDPVFRLGVRVWLNQSSDISLIVEAEDGETALQILDHQFASPVDAESNSLPVNLVVLDLGLGRSNPNQIQGLSLCNILKSRYPWLPILGLGTQLEPIVLAAAQQAGANGYCPKTANPVDMVAVMRRIAAGQSYWISEAVSQNVLSTSDLPAAALPRSSALLAPLRRSLRLTGVRQIEAALSEVTVELQNPDLSLLDRAILAGRQRELRASRWLVSRLLATPALEDSEQSRVPAEREPSPSSGSASGRSAPPPSAIVPVAEAAIVDVQGIQSVVFDAVFAKIQTGIANHTDMALETDILREDKKRELFYLVLRKLEEVLSELRYSQVETDQLPLKQSAILLDLWQAVLIDFFGRYYTVRLGATEVEVTDVLLQDAPIVQSAILEKIPGVTELLRHFLFQAPLPVDSIPYAAGNPESVARAELLLENLTIQVANAVMQPLLNRFPNVEAIKQIFYDRRLLSSREIERFRNNLSWKYRLDRIVREPKHIFESQYQLLMLTGHSIQQTLIYAPRTVELAQLSGLPYVVTLALETRDAVAPRLRSAVSFVGNGLVYVLTEVIGRGIGLIGRGILKGLGNVWQDSTKYGRDRQQR